MAYLKETCIAGKTIEITKRHSSRYGKKGILRGKNISKTNKQMAKINAVNAETKLRRLVNANFGYRDILLTLTYIKNERPNEEQAKKMVERFKRKLREVYKKNNMELKYVVVTEYKSTAIHHHFIINEMNKNQIAQLWEHGKAVFTCLDRSGQYGGLVHYLLKETQNTYVEENSPSKKRWDSSKNLKKPIIEKIVIQARKWKEDPKEIKGYMLDRNSIQKGVHSFTGWPFQFYSMVAINGTHEPKSSWDWEKILNPQKKNTLLGSIGLQVNRQCNKSIWKGKEEKQQLDKVI